MSKQTLDARCPGCGHEVSVNVEIPEAKEIIKLVPQEDTAKVDKLTEELGEAQQTVDALRSEVDRWQNGESHLTAQDMLTMLESCPNCRPTLDAFVAGVRKKAVSSLTPEQVKVIARQQKWWPPPPIELSLPLSRKARL